MTRSQLVVLLADMASHGKYDNVTPAGARKMNRLFELVAQLINELEAEEREQAAQINEQNEGNETDGG